MKVKIYVQEEELHHLYNFFKNYDNLEDVEKYKLRDRIKRINYYTDFEEFANIEYLGKMIEVIIDYSEYVKLEYLD